MATSKEYIEYVCEQINGLGDIRYRKMFGEYMVYVDDKPIYLVCDNMVFIKQLPSLESYAGILETGVPYEGSKPHYILDIEDKAQIHGTAEILLKAIQVPKPKKRNNDNHTKKAQG